jgi:hypothetical protein
MIKSILTVFIAGYALACLIRHSNGPARSPAFHAALMPLTVQKETVPLSDEMPDWWTSDDQNIADPYDDRKWRSNAAE